MLRDEQRQREHAQAVARRRERYEHLLVALAEHNTQVFACEEGRRVGEEKQQSGGGVNSRGGEVGVERGRVVMRC